MSGAYGNIRGTIFKAPESKQSKSGNDYASATLKVKDGNETKFWRVMAFKNASAALMAFNDGDLVQAEGGIKVDTWQKDSETRLSFTLLANSVEAYSPPEKKPQSTGSRPERSQSS